MNRENLTKLATYLEALSADYTHFHMSSYFRGGDGPHFVNDAPFAGSCGTVACAVGHGPAAGIPANEGTVWWSDYAEEAFELQQKEWEWCFASMWVVVDNTPQGAAKRIQHLLEHGLPDDAVRQIYGEAPYLFAKQEV